MNDSFSAASQRATAPFRYDIVGSFLRSEPLKEARQRFAQARLTQRELRQVEDAEIVKLIAKQKALGLHAVEAGGTSIFSGTSKEFKKLRQNKAPSPLRAAKPRRKPLK